MKVAERCRAEATGTRRRCAVPVPGQQPHAMRCMAGNEPGVVPMLSVRLDGRAAMDWLAEALLRGAEALAR